MLFQHQDFLKSAYALLNPAFAAAIWL